MKIIYKLILLVLVMLFSACSYSDSKPQDISNNSAGHSADFLFRTDGEISFIK